LDISASAELDLTEAFTVSVWLATDAGARIDGCLVEKNATVGAAWSLAIEADQRVAFATTMNLSPVVQRSTIAMSMPAWHHVAIWWDGSLKQIFSDGASAGT
jgi:hypothetical protein